MLKFPRPSRIRTILFLACLAPAAVFANGQSEDLIQKAQTLMDGKDFRAALILLQDIGTRHPDKLDEVQAYINVCMQHIQSVNELEEKILDALDNNDDETAVVLMDRLKALDPRELDFESEYFRAKKLSVAYKKFQELMDAAAALTARARYREAIDTYREGFTLYREEFLSNPVYVADDVARVQGTYIEIDALISDFYSRTAAAERSSRAVLDLSSGGRLAEGLARAEGALGDLDSLLDLRLRMIALGRRFRDLNESFKKKSPGGKGDNLFYFSQHTILGRDTNNAPLGREGVYYVFEAQWEALLEQTMAPLVENAVRFFRLARESERAGNADQAGANYVQAERFAAGAAAFCTRYLDAGAPDAPRRLDGRDRKYLYEKYPRFAYLDELSLEARKYRGYLGLQRSLAVIDRNVSAGAEDAVLNRSHNEARNAIALLETDAAALAERRRTVDRLKASGFDLSDTAGLLPEFEARLAGLLSDYRKLNIGFAARVVARELSPVRDAYANNAGRLEAANGIRDGTKPVAPRKTGEKRPSDALRLYDALKRDLERDNPADRFLGAWRKESEAVLADPAVKPYIEEAEKLAVDWRALSASVDAEADRARVMRDEAMALYARAQAEYQKAGQEAAKKSWEEARRQLSLAAKDAADSLASEETDQARALTASVRDLEAKIAAASIDARLTESNDNRDRGIERYFLQDFEAARALLERAKNIILDLGSGENGDPGAADTSTIQFWLDLVLKALASAPVRQISQKDPLYAEITARQRQAEFSYQAGLEYQKNGREEDARKSFQDALLQIEQIQKTFPQLRESGVLYIKVVQAQRGAAWFNEYIGGLINEAERTDPRQALAKLEDALILVPGNQRLKQALDRVAARLYVRPVVSEQARAQAANLYDQAAGLIRPVSATRTDYDTALRLVNQALLLDPYSGRAKDLQTVIRKRIYGR